jgi:hypothetical protein
MQWRRVGRIAATVLAGLLLPVAVGAVGLARATSEIYTPRDANAPPVTVDAAVAPVHDPAKPTVAIVLSPAGTNAADVLAPYEVLADTGAFNVYTVAAQRQPVPMTGGRRPGSGSVIWTVGRAAARDAGCDSRAAGS